MQPDPWSLYTGNRLEWTECRVSYHRQTFCRGRRRSDSSNRL